MSASGTVNGTRLARSARRSLLTERSAQRDAAAESVKAMVALDEIARREPVVVSDEDLAQEIGRFAERSGRTPEAVRAQIEKDNGLARLRGGLRREKTVDLLLANAAITTD